MNFQRPESLLEGHHYWLYFANDDQGLPMFTDVTFVDFTACPAIVIVKDMEKYRMRCNRLDLYMIADNIQTSQRKVQINIPHTSPIPG